MCSPHPWVVSTVISPLGHTETAQCTIGPVALSSCTVQIQLKLSVQQLQYHGQTDNITLTGTVVLYILSHATRGDWPLAIYLR